MESPQNIKKRLKSVSNINKITKAMEMVAATKMRKSQEIALASRPYAFAALDFLATVSSFDPEKLPELFKKREVNPVTGTGLRVLFVLISSDKGLAGAFNSSVFRKFEQHMKEYPSSAKGFGAEREQKFFVAVGEKAFNYLTKKYGTTDPLVVLKKFTQVGDFTTPEQVKPLSDFLVKGYLNKDFDRVIVVSTHFRSALKQEPHVRRILPIDFDHIADTIKEIIPERGKFAELIKEHNINFVPNKANSKEYLIEPSAKEVLEKLAEHLFFIQIYHLILEANASEHSARRMAMKTASDNASELGEALNLQYNKSRQSKITTEISEISAGAEALS
ncbi:MAG: ATP synthase F1 subunit gamma [Candidatus Staskawiczbacteria bacterium]|nr:ATP synthase F1 subunit gamma [Candidatus Staskawiczbacteria bacterium]